MVFFQNTTKNRTASGTLDVEAVDFINRVEAQTGVISTSNKIAYSTAVRGLKALNNSITGLSEWASIKELYIPIHNDHASSVAPAMVKSKIPFGKSGTLTNNGFAAANYTLQDGLRGDAAADRSITTDMIVNDLSFDNFHVMVGYNLLAEETLNAARLYGVPAGVFQSSWATANLRLNTYGNVAQSAQIISSLKGNAGLDIFNSEASNVFKEYHAGLQNAISTTTRSAWSNTSPINFFWSGSGNTHFSGNIWGYSIGTKFDPANIPAIDAIFRALFTALGRNWGNVFFEGDATVFGTGTTTGSYPSRTMKEAGGRLGQFNSGTAGHSIATINTNKATEYPTRITSADIYFLHAGYHDLNAAATADTMWTNVESILAYVQGTLGVFNTVIATLPGSTDYTVAENDQRLLFNDLIRANTATWGYAIADFANDPDIGTSNVTYFNGNQNFNDAGALIAATIAGAAVLSVSQYTNVTPGVSGNRIATEADRTLYGTYITVGDLIIDSTTFTNPDGSKNATYYFMGTQWPTLSGSPTIWLDGDTLCPGGVMLNEIKFQNSSNVATPWSVDNATFKNIPGTKVITKNFTCHGLLNWKIECEGVLADAWLTGRKFLSGYFGLRVIQPLFNGHGITGSVRNGGSIELSGFEIQHGFSGVRLMPTGGNLIVTRLKIHDFYIHDTAGGEGFYLGSTKSPPIPRFENVEIYQGIIARTACEAMQFQNFAGSDVHNVTIYCSDTEWLAAFQPFQDTCIQWSLGGGQNKLRNILINGYGSAGLMPFGVAPANYFSNPPNTALAENLKYFQGRGIGAYFNNACSNGVAWTLLNCLWADFNDTYYGASGVAVDPDIINTGNLRSDGITITNLTHDGSKTNPFDDVSEYTISGTVLDAATPAPVHTNDGFDNLPAKVMQWKQYWGYYFPNSDTTPTHWNLNDIAIDVDEATETYEFYKCILAHDSTSTRPKANPTRFTKLTWDTNGIRSDKGGWGSGLAQSDYPPDDLRLVSGSPYALIGFQTN